MASLLHSNAQLALELEEEVSAQIYVAWSVLMDGDMQREWWGVVAPC